MQNLITIKTLAQLKELEQYLADKEYVAFDTETTGLDSESEIIGFSVCADVEVGYYVILSYWDVNTKKLVYLETKGGSIAFLQTLKQKKLIMHNGVFDCSMVHNNFRVSLIDSLFHDTMISGHLLNENRQNGLKERGVALYGEDTRKEQEEMKASVHDNGGVLTKEKYELYKADAELIAHYGAKDAILTLKLFYEDVPVLFEQGLDSFFYDDESMPLLRGPTYELNTTGLRVDPEELQRLKGALEAECLEAKAFIHNEIRKYVMDKYPGTSKSSQFNIGASRQLAWLLYFKLGNEFHILTEGGRDLCKALSLDIPYSPGAKREFIRVVTENAGRVYAEAEWNPKTKKMGRPKIVGDPWIYLACGKEALGKLSKKYRWVERLLEYAKALKLLNFYVLGIQTRMKYNIIRPSFLQHGTTSGRYSSKNPNFQNLPRKDKRIKGCIVSRPGNVFVGADYSQLEPRVFASFSGDERLLKGFADGDDFYSIIGVEVFEKYGASLKKDHIDSFANKFPGLRDLSKVIGLATTYGTTAPQMSRATGKTIEECQAIIDSYFEKFPKVLKFMLDCHTQAKKHGEVVNLFGRPRRMPDAKMIEQLFGKTSHARLPYEARNILNLAVNHTVQSTGASIMNRAAIKCWTECKKRATLIELWASVKIVLQVHDELILEGPSQLAEGMTAVLKDAMENAITLPGVALIAEPKVGKTLAELK